MFFKSEIKLKTQGNNDCINITSQVEDIVKKSSIKDGIVLICVIGSTCGLTTIEYEPNLIKDFQELLEKIVPSNRNYHHNKTWGEDNGFSHLRASLIGQSFCCIIEEGNLVLGSWQQIVFCDFDTQPRERKIIIKIIGEQT